MKTKEEYLKIASNQLDYIDLEISSYDRDRLCSILYISYLKGSRDADIATLKRMEANKLKRETR